MIVGDVHGCADELSALLEAHFDPSRMTLVLAGDIVNKGPKSCEAVSLARRHGAWAVRGNHESAVLFHRAERCKTTSAGNEPSNSFYAWTDNLTDDDVEYLSSLP